MSQESKIVHSSFPYQPDSAASRVEVTEQPVQHSDKPLPMSGKSNSEDSWLSYAPDLPVDAAK